MEWEIGGLIAFRADSHEQSFTHIFIDSKPVISIVSIDYRLTKMGNKGMGRNKEMNSGWLSAAGTCPVAHAIVCGLGMP